MSYEADLRYERWRRGANPDDIDPDRIEHYKANGLTIEEAADRLDRLDKRRREERDMREWEANEWDLAPDERFYR